MSLSLFNPTSNLLPYDGTVIYFGRIFSKEDAQHYFQLLMQEIEWKNDEAVIFGKRIITARKAAWYGDRPYHYTYSKTTKLALPWTRELLALKDMAELKSAASYNSCLLNLYHSGEEGMAYHSDAEPTLAYQAPIASLSFGAGRPFHFRHKRTKETVTVFLEPGSLLVMKDATQTNWLHRLPPTKKVKEPRINLTFRTIEGQ